MRVRRAFSRSFDRPSARSARRSQWAASMVWTWALHRLTASVGASRSSFSASSMWRLARSRWVIGSDTGFGPGCHEDEGVFLDRSVLFQLVDVAGEVPDRVLDQNQPVGHM